MVKLLQSACITLMETMSVSPYQIAKRNDIVAVLGSDNTYWLCKVLENQRRNSSIKGLWLEREDGQTYSLGMYYVLVVIKPKLNFVHVNCTYLGHSIVGLRSFLG